MNKKQWAWEKAVESLGSPPPNFGMDDGLDLIHTSNEWYERAHKRAKGIYKWVKR